MIDIKDQDVRIARTRRLNPRLPTDTEFELTIGDDITPLTSATLSRLINILAAFRKAGGFK